jgi:hypothetical protein
VGRRDMASSACDSMSPGVCAAGQQALGTFFSFFFGSISRLATGNRVAGRAVGASVGVLAAASPDAVPDAATVLLVAAASLAGAHAAGFLFPELDLAAALLATAAPVASLYFLHQHQHLRALQKRGKEDNGSSKHVGVGEGELAHHHRAAATAIHIER